MSSFSKFNGKTVVITGHTGFKGSWMTAWLKQLGANVIGISLEPPTIPSHYIASHIEAGICHNIMDVRDQGGVSDLIFDSKPDFLFHLAAQSLVRQSFLNPIENWTTNVNGTVNVLDALRRLDKPCVGVFITSDKCYDNVEWVWGYRETDPLGGKDPYSASKGAAEMAIRAYSESYFSNEKSDIRIASVRAGNVIGGGDWAVDRIIPDAMRAWSRNQSLLLRSPMATRPWQHVLEPISGYLALALKLEEAPNYNGQSFNFGPSDKLNHSVVDVVTEMSKNWPGAKFEMANIDALSGKESGLLKLNCDKALSVLDWHGVLDFERTINMTVDWYKFFYKGSQDTKDKTLEQIDLYTKLARQCNLRWTL